MPQPKRYIRQFSFTAFASSQPQSPLPGLEVDVELNAVRFTLDGALDNLALIQRDDGQLGNATVGLDQLREEVRDDLAAFVTGQVQPLTNAAAASAGVAAGSASSAATRAGQAAASATSAAGAAASADTARLAAQAARTGAEAAASAGAGHAASALASQTAAAASRTAATASAMGAAADADGAAASATAALGSAAAAAAHAASALALRDDALAGGAEAAASATASATSAALAGAARTDTLAARNAAEGFRNQAEVFRDQAEAAAANANDGIVLSSVPAAPLGVSAAAGTSAEASRGDHAHPLPTAAAIQALAASQNLADVPSKAAARASLGIANHDRVNVDGSGRVGIGTAASAAQLEACAPADPTIRVRASSFGAGNAGLGLRDHNQSTAEIEKRTDAGAPGAFLDLAPITSTPGAPQTIRFFRTSTASGRRRVEFQRGGATGEEAGTIDAAIAVDAEPSFFGLGGGKVGIGTAAPTQALDVLGTVKATAFQGDGSALTGIAPGLPDPTTAPGDLIVRGATGATRLGIGSAGQVLTVADGAPAWAAAAAAGGSLGAVIKGLALSRGNPSFRVVVQAGFALSQDRSQLLTLGTALTKFLNAPWSAGSLVGMLDTGSMTAGQWYHVHLIGNGTASDVLASLSYASPALPAGWTRFQPVGAVFCANSTGIFRFTQVVDSDFFLLDDIGPFFNDISAGAVSSSASSPTIWTLASVPKGCSVRAHLNVRIEATGDSVALALAPGDQQTPIVPLVGGAGYTGVLGLQATGASSLKLSGQQIVRTDTQGRVKALADNASRIAHVTVVGFDYPRGRHFS